MKTRYSIVGLGKLGASMAAGLAKHGCSVIGVDVNKKAVEAVNAGHAPVQETNLEETIQANKERIQATLSHREAVLNTDITFVIVPTPSDERGAFSLQYSIWAFREIGKALKEKKGYHNVVLTSTVLPGSTRYGLLPVLEKESGRKCGKDFGLCYSPEFIALGSIIRDFLNPDFILVGQVDEKAGAHLESCYAEFMENNPPCMRMSLENAELTKLALNTYVTTKITYANMLADLCERIPGGDVDVVTNALGYDKRVGSKYLKGALGYGGPCFPRDNVALGFAARFLGTRADIAETTDKANRSLADRVVTQLQSHLRKGMTVAVLGLSYKPFSHVVEESQAIKIVKALNNAGVRVVAYDPLAMESAKSELEGNLVCLDSVKACLEQADAVIVATPDPEFGKLTADHFKGKKPPFWVFDFWRILKKQLSGLPNVKYIPFGCSTDDPANEARLKTLWGSVADK